MHLYVSNTYDSYDVIVLKIFLQILIPANPTAIHNMFGPYYKMSM